MMKIKLFILLVLLMLLLLTLDKNVKEHFSCLSKYYYKDKDDTFFSIFDSLCSGFTDEECTDFKEECIVSNFDYKKLKDGNSEEVNDMLESMLHTCMSPNPDIVINDKCLKKEFGQKSRPRRQGNSNAISSYNNITKKCKIKQNSTYKKYVLDPHCKLFD